ncbi:MAG: hypothetical protein WC919_05415 [Candidatus Paceibacterota bacterium]
MSKYIEEEIYLLKQFQENWLRLNVVDPKSYPLDIDAGEWEQQIVSVKNTGVAYGV